MPKSLADGRIKLSIMSTKPADPYAPTVTELEAGVDASMAILSSGFRLGPVASDTVDEKPVGQEGNVSVLTTSNYEAAMTAFRAFDATGASEATADATFQALKEKGTRVWIGKRFTSKKSAEAWAATDEVEVYEIVTDNASDAEATGYIKKVIPMSVEDAWLNGEVAAGV